jgi:peptidoglycan/xylan/chitin deacetylase (PgdA/CDA1 family)
VVIGKRPSGEIIGISFHAIGLPTADLTAAERPYAVTRDTFLLLLDEFAAHPEVELSFDDGFASDVETALPALTERGLSATFFPVAARLGRPGFVDLAGLRALNTAGMTIGLHGMRHRSWRGLDPEAEREELVLARSLIAEAASADVTSVSCPFGSYDRKVLRTLREYGYQRVFTSDRRRARAGAWLQPRYAMMAHDTVRTVRDHVLTARPLHERTRRAATSKVKAWR